MAISTQTVIINVKVQGGKIDDVINEKPINNATTAMSRFVGTLGKALVSMAGVLVAFNLFVTLPQAIAKGLFALGATVIKFGEDVQKTILQTAGLVASFGTFGGSAEQSFESAIKASRRLQLTFASLAAKSLATAEDMQKGFQVFVARGGLSYVGGDIDKAAKLTAFLVNLTIALTGDLQKEKQIYTEIDAVMQRQARSGAVVAKLLKASVGDLNAYMNLHRKQGDLLEDLERRFGGIVLAADRLGSTLTGIMTSITGSAGVLNGIAYQSGAFTGVSVQLKGWRDALASAVFELGNLKNATDVLSPKTQKVLDAFLSLNIAVSTVVQSVGTLIRAIMNAEDEAGTLQSIAAKLLTVGNFAASFGYGKAWVEETKKYLALVEKARAESAKSPLLTGMERVDYTTQLKPALAFIDRLRAVGLSDVLGSKEIDETTLKLIDFTRKYKDVKDIGSLTAKNYKVYEQEALALLNSMDTFVSGFTPTAARTIFGKLQDSNLKQIKELRDRVKQSLVDDPNAKLTLFGGDAGDENAKLVERAKKEIIKMQREVAVLAAGENTILRINEEQLGKRKELEETYKKVPAQLKVMLNLLDQQTKGRLEQRYASIEAGTIKNLRDRLSAAGASYNAFAEMADKVRSANEKNNTELMGTGVALKRVIDLTGLAAIAEATAQADLSTQTALYSIMAEKQGEIAVLDEKHRRDLEALNALDVSGQELEAKNKLIAAVIAQHNAEEELLIFQQNTNAASLYRDLNTQLEKAMGNFNALKTLDAARVDAEAEILKNTKLSSMQQLGLIALTRQLYTWKKQTIDLDARIQSADIASDRTRTLTMRVKEANEAFIKFGGSVKTVNTAIAGLSKQYMDNLRTIGEFQTEIDAGAKGENLEKLQNAVRALTAANKEALSELSAMTNVFAQLNAYAERGINLFNAWANGGVKLKTMLVGLAQTFVAKFSQGVAQAFTSMMVALREGESVLGDFKKFLGGILVAVGQELMALGVAEVAAGIGLFGAASGAKIWAGLKQIAVGAATISAGVAMGAGGSSSSKKDSSTSSGTTTEPKPVFTRQQDVEAQQGIQLALQENTAAIRGLNGEVGRLSKENGDVLVMKTVKNNAAAVASTVVNKMSGSYSLQKKFGTAIAGSAY
jgi:hypothetical protein